MRLLNVHTYKLHDFIGNDIPPYAILSHRWEEEEVTFQALQAGDGPGMKGWHKIQGCCKQALQDEFEYVWIDSCCIDKSSSAELTEAINSMFNWYQDAEACFAFLSDVSIDVCFTPGLPTEDGAIPDWLYLFHDSKWFTRGWTLQELLAPENLIFFDQNWKVLGTKESLEGHVSSITGIKDMFNFDKASIAQTFSWASKRQTTRVEDAAYCLMGLFRVNMALLYGEGEAAFLRLQLEILKISNDESIFAWKNDTVPGICGGLLAPEPACFMKSNDIECVHPQHITRRPYAMTNNGLEFEARLIPVVKDIKDDETVHTSNTSKQVYMCPLNCVRQGKKSHLISLFLSRREGSSISGEHLSRVFSGKLSSLNVQDIVAGNVQRDTKAWTGTIFVQQPHLSLRSTRRSHPQSIFRFDSSQLYSSGIVLRQLYFDEGMSGGWDGKLDNEGILKLPSRSTALMKFSKFSKVSKFFIEEVSFILRISCRASSATLGLQLRRNAGAIDDLFGKFHIISEKWLQACSFVDHAVAFEVAKSNRISQSLHPFAKGSVVAVFQKRLANREYYDVKLSVEV